MTTTPPPPPGPHPQQTYGTTWQDPQPGHDPSPGHQGWGPGHPSAPPVPPQTQPPTQQKSWFRRHKVMTAMLVIVALIVIGNLVGGGEDESGADGAASPVAEQRAAHDAPAAADAEPAPRDAEVEAEAEAAAAQEAEAEAAAAREAEEAAEAEAAAAREAEEAAEAEAAPGLGDAVRDGNFEFTVNEVETGLTTIGEGLTQESPQGQFVLIRISVTNIGDQGATMFDSAQTLIDEQGREHSTSSASIWLDEGLWLDEINPGNSVSGVLLYDIPTDATPTSLELHDSMFSGGVTISLD